MMRDTAETKEEQMGVGLGGGVWPPYVGWHNGNELKIDHETQKVFVNGEHRKMEPRLYKTLVLLIDNKGRFVLYGRFAALGSHPRLNSKVARVSISQLKKLLPELEDAIQNERRVGYGFFPDGARTH